MVVMKVKEKIIAAAESTFDHHGFTGTGLDQLTEAAAVSSRTLYKYFGSKANLMASALAHRRERFFATLDVDCLDLLFVRLAAWAEKEGARGCLFLRALGDTGGSVDAVAAEVAAYHEELGQLVTRLVKAETGNTGAAEGVLILIEGAVATASYRGAKVFDTARVAAAILLKH